METIRKINNYISSYWFFLIHGAVLWTYLKIGKIPSFASPDPKEVLESYKVLFVICNYSTYFIILGVFLNTWFFIRNLKSIGRLFETSTIFFAINISLWLIYLFIDPFGFNEWFFD